MRYLCLLRLNDMFSMNSSEVRNSNGLVIWKFKKQQSTNLHLTSTYLGKSTMKEVGRILVA